MKKAKKTLKELRKQNRYTIKEVAEKTGIAFSTYTSYEMGYRMPRVDNAQKLAEFYGCKVDDIDFSETKK